MADRGRQAVNAHYSLTAMLDRYERIFGDFECGTRYQRKTAAARNQCLSDSTRPMVTAISEGLA
jgi:hypothetical protein